MQTLMAAPTTTKLNPAFAAEVAKLQPALHAWRKQRKHREPIPEPLWWDMVRLARAYRASPVAQVLRVNYTTLKRRLLDSLSIRPAERGQTPDGQPARRREIIGF
jgi:hypothetical protein